MRWILLLSAVALTACASIPSYAWENPDPSRVFAVDNGECEALALRAAPMPATPVPTTSPMPQSYTTTGTVNGVPFRATTTPGSLAWDPAKSASEATRTYQAMENVAAVSKARRDYYAACLARRGWERSNLSASKEDAIRKMDSETCFSYPCLTNP